MKGSQDAETATERARPPRSGRPDFFFFFLEKKEGRRPATPHCARPVAPTQIRTSGRRTAGMPRFARRCPPLRSGRRDRPLPVCLALLVAPPHNEQLWPPATYLLPPFLAAQRGREIHGFRLSAQRRAFAALIKPRFVNVGYFADAPCLRFVNVGYFAFALKKAPRRGGFGGL